MNEKEKLIPQRRFKEFKNTGTWEQRKLGDTFEFSVSTNSLSRAQLNYEKGNIKSIHYGDILIKYNSILEITKDKIPFITDGSIEKYKPNLLENGDVVFADAAEDETVGKAVEINGISDEYVVAGLHTIVARPKEKMAKYFSGYYINADVYQRQLLRLMQGTKVSSISKGNLKKTIVAYPKNLAEQQKIGSFFKQLDNAIALHQQKQRQIRSLKQGFIKNLFPNNKNSAPRIRFSIFNDDWNQRNASEIFTSVSDKNYPELPVLSASQEKGMVLRESNGIDIKYDQKSTGTYKRVLPGQFVMHLRSFQGGFAYSTIEGITSPAYTILAFRNKEDHYPLFWKSIFSSKNFIKRLEAITYGIRDGRSISYADFSTLRFWIPSYEEQKQIGDFIESIDATIAFYQRQIDMMQSLKKELLNKMFI